MSNTRTIKDVVEDLQYLDFRLHQGEIPLDEYYTLYSELEEELLKLLKS
jgi:hypothetical protein